MQLFYWADFSHDDYEQQRTYYKGFTLNDASYSIGDCVLLLPESADEPYHIGCIQSAFTDCAPDVRETQCIEVRSIHRILARDVFNPRSFMLPILCSGSLV
jgi:hypothetical protein